jgi:hypothetical protein
MTMNPQPPSPTVGILYELAITRREQDWSGQNHPDGTGTDWRIFGRSADEWLTVVRAVLDRSTKWQVAGSLDEGLREVPPTGPTWLLIALEEAFEAFVEADPAKLRAELVQLGAVTVAWIEAIDRRTTG